MKNILLILIVVLGVGCGGKEKDISLFFDGRVDSVRIYDGIVQLKAFRLGIGDMRQLFNQEGIEKWDGEKWVRISLDSVLKLYGAQSSTSNDSLVYIVDTGLYAPNAHLSTTGGAIDAYMIYLDSIYGRWAMRDTMQIFGHAYDDDALNYIRACGADSILGKYNWRQLDNGDIEYFDKKWIKVVPRQQRGNAIMSIPGNDWPSPTYPLKGSEDFRLPKNKYIVYWTRSGCFSKEQFTDTIEAKSVKDARKIFQKRLNSRPKVFMIFNTIDSVKTYLGNYTNLAN